MAMTDTLRSLGARLTTTDDDVRALLEKDHDEIKEILKGLDEGKQGASRAALLQKLKRTLTAHARAEEKVVYDAMIRVRAKQETHVLAEEGYVEHHVVDDLLARISRLTPGNELWKAHVKVLRESLEHHISEEQNQMFGQLGECFSRDELVAMGAQFLRRKAAVSKNRASKTQRNVARVVAGQRARAATKGARRGTRKPASKRAAGQVVRARKARSR